MVVHRVSSTGIRILLFAVFLVLLTVFPRFCTSVTAPKPVIAEPETLPPSGGPVAGGVLRKMTPTVIATSDKKKFTLQDRQQVEQEAMILEWELCEEKEPSADECRVSRVQVSPTMDDRAVARIYLEYHYWDWDSPRPKTLSTSRVFERFADGWVLAE